MENCGLRGNMLEKFLACSKFTNHLNTLITVKCIGISQTKWMFSCCNCRCVILLPIRDHKIFVVSLIDSFVIDCITFHEHPSTYFTAKFHDIDGIQGCLWRFYVYRLQYKKYSSGCGGYDQSILNRALNVLFSNQNYSFIVSSDLKQMTSFWFDRLFMDDLP